MNFIMGRATPICIPLSSDQASPPSFNPVLMPTRAKKWPNFRSHRYLMLFRPFRLLILLGIAFIAGILYERGEIKARCEQVGGDMESGFCER